MINMDAKKSSIAVVSGGFDPLHVGHIRLFNQARSVTSCDLLWVIMNNDNWLKAKKGYVFMPQLERVEILNALRSVDMVLTSMHVENDPRQDICKEIEYIAYAMPQHRFIFCNGGDRGRDNTPEVELCKNIGWRTLFGVGGIDKVQSSSDLVLEASMKGFKHD